MEWWVQVLIGVLLALLVTRIGLGWLWRSMPGQEPDYATPWQRLCDELTYRPPTNEQIAEQVARSVANTCYRSWHSPEEHAGPSVSHLRHSFTELTAEEIAAQKETPYENNK